MAANTPVYRGTITSALVETPQSGAYEVGDRITFTQEFRGKYSDCISSLPFKGTLGSGATAGLRVLQSTVSKDRGATGVLRIVWEAYASSSGATLPADEFTLDPFDINPDIFQHPYWAASTALTDAEITALQTLRNAQSSTQFDLTSTTLSGTKAALFKGLLKKGIQNYQFSAFRYAYIWASWTEPTLNRKAFIQSAGGPLSSTLSGLSSLRIADSLTNAGGFYKITQTWLVGAGGYWDTTLYDSANAP